ncbi:hypothetical protein A6A19_02150 [Actinobacillus delphinicola]|uniref:LppC family lipoprotein n=1 Tax=Actinobacillus delphinicola TaxID=51161 RepID=A0A448TS78_9PAST|nr:penicillin-binding protein activator [Actinobacillus delphinicola]MDG6896830.1 hypothetical protein [Actinobacillus delphinicola]VEJ08638.1 LppC family lipoprotein [Actinobacillus delphinicola]
MLSHRKSFKHLLAPISLSLFLAGCGNLNYLFDNSGDLLSQEATANSDYYLRHSMQTQDVTIRNDYKLLAARAMLHENKFAQAQGLLTGLQGLDSEQSLDRTLIQARLAILLNNTAKAQQLLQQVDFSSLTNNQKVRFLRITAKIQQAQNNSLAAINSLIQADAYLSSNTAHQQNNDAIWAVLRKTDPSIIQNAMGNPENPPVLQGWLALADLYNKNIHSPETLRQNLQIWRTNYGMQVTDDLLPSELKGILNYQHVNINNVALLLPLSGNVQLIGQTVEKGFDAANKGSGVPVTVFDTMKMSMSDIMDQVKAQGITTVVGPLLKQNVDQLISHPSWTSGLQVLTLNSTQDDPALSQVCYFGLAPEDEARAAADRMWQQNVRLPLILVPQNNLGQRIATAFNTRWQALGGGDTEVSYYNDADDLRPIFVKALGIIDVSKDTKDAATAPRSRQEIDPSFKPVDGVFALGNNTQLGNIKNALDNTNVAIPLFTTSRINSPNNLGTYRLSMNGTQFTDLPLFSQGNSAQFQQILQANKGDYSLMRLYAMGEDAWTIINNMNALRTITGFHVQGLTGNLSANYGCHINRDMTWYSYKNGALVVADNNPVAQPSSSVISTSTTNSDTNSTDPNATLTNNIATVTDAINDAKNQPTSADQNMLQAY